MNENEKPKTALNIEYVSTKDSFDPAKLNKSKKKLWDYFQEVIKQDSFIVAIQAIKSKYIIPHNGFENENKYRDWRIRQNNVVNELYLSNDISTICKKYKLRGFGFHPVVMDIILFNKVSLENIHKSKLLPFFYKVDPAGVLGQYDLCSIRDLPTEEEIPNKEIYLNKIKSTWPVAIVISPYAGQNDIKEYLQDNWKIIEHIQEKYKNSSVKIGGYKTGKKKERDNFIYENRTMNKKELADIVNEKYGTYFIYADINTIISHEKKRRKKM